MKKLNNSNLTDIQIITVRRVVYIAQLMVLSFFSFYSSYASSSKSVVELTEERVNAILRQQLDEDLFHVLVTSNEQPATTESSTKSVNVPYSTLKIDPNYLNKMLENKTTKEYMQAQVAVEITYDPSVGEELQQILSNKVQSNLRLNTAQRTITSKTASLIVEKKGSREDLLQLQLQEEKVKLEQLELEKERDSFESAKATADLEDSIKDSQDQIAKLNDDIKALQIAKDDEVKKANEEAEKKIADAEKRLQEKGEPTLAEKIGAFDFVILPAVIGLFLLLAAIFVLSGFKGGLKSLSDSLTSVGESVVAASSNLSSVFSSNESNIGDDSSSGDEKAKESSASSSENSLVETERIEEFLKLTEEKVEVLTQEKNFNFFRHFMDLVDENVFHAAAILVTVQSQTANALLNSLPVDYVLKIQNTITSPGGLQRAKNNRRDGLEAFYGKIAMDEFLDSPIQGIKGAEWLTSLSTADLNELVAALTDEQKKAFVACLTPTRLALMLENAKDPAQKTQIFNAIKEIDLQPPSEFEQVLGDVRQVAESLQQSKETRVKTLMNGPQFFAKIISEIGMENRDEMLKLLAYRSDIIEGIKRYYIPFSDIEFLHQDTVTDIFGKRPSEQISMIVFSTTDAVRNKIIASLPDILQETVRENLEGLLAEESKAPQYLKKSLALQDEISKYLLKLNREGLLRYDGSVSESGTSAA